MLPASAADRQRAASPRGQPLCFHTLEAMASDPPRTRSAAPSAPILPPSLQIYPAAILRKKAEPIAEITAEVRAFADKMVEIMQAEEGIGLAAPQAGRSWRMFVVDVPPSEDRSADTDPPTASRGVQVYINPVLSKPTGTPVAAEEGCLSLPEIRGDVLRPPVITITAIGLDGKQLTQTAGGLLARCWQHENDHLDGVLIIDKMTQMSRLKNRGAVRDLERGG